MPRARLLLILILTTLSCPRSDAEIRRHRVNPPRPAAAMLLGGPQHTNVSDLTLPVSDLHVAWRAPLPEHTRRGARLILATPAQDGFGDLYVASTSGVLAAFNDDGERIWSRELPGEISSTPALDGLGRLFIATRQGELLAIDTSDGSRLWSQPITPPVYASPTLDGDRVYISAADTTSAFTTSGAHLWTYVTVHSPGTLNAHRTEELNSTPTVAPDGTVLITSWSGYLIALHRDSGLELWRNSIGFADWFSIPTLSDDQIRLTFLTHANSPQALSFVQAYSLDGSGLLWDRTIGPSRTFASSNDHGHLLTSDYTGALYAFDDAGNERFSSHIPDASFTASIATDAHGNLLAVSRDGSALVLDPHGHIIAWQELGLTAIEGSPIIGLPHDGLARFYVAASGELVAVEGSPP